MPDDDEDDDKPKSMGGDSAEQFPIVASGPETGRLIALNAGSDILSRMTVEELRAELASTLLVTANHLIHIADVWQELNRRGEDLSALRSGLWKYMPLIASGELQPELVVRYAGNSKLLRRLSAIPRYEQDLLLASDEIPLSEYVDGEIRHRKARIAQLGAREIDLVFRGRILSWDNQDTILRSRFENMSRSNFRALERKVMETAKTKQKPIDKAQARGVRLSLTEGEWLNLNQRATKAGISVGALVVGALQIVGIIQKP